MCSISLMFFFTFFQLWKKFSKNVLHLSHVWKLRKSLFFVKKNFKNTLPFRLVTISLFLKKWLGEKLSLLSKKKFCIWFFFTFWWKNKNENLVSFLSTLRSKIFYMYPKNSCFLPFFDVFDVFLKLNLRFLMLFFERKFLILRFLRPFFAFFKKH
jgi:hypothetical protein